MTPETVIALAIAGLLLLFCEVFVPGGIVGGIGAICLIIGIIGGFTISVNWGFGLLVGTLVVGLVGFWLWVKYFPTSPIGKKLILQNDAHDWQGYSNTKQELVGKEGIAHSPLRPAGTAIIDGQRVDVVTRGDMIESDAAIRVVEVEGNRVVVKAV